MKSGSIRQKGVASRRSKNAKHQPPPGATAWKLPSGRELSEYALRAGFLVPSLLCSYAHAGVRTPGSLQRGSSQIGGCR